MEIVVGELVSRLIGILLRPLSLVSYALVTIALTTGLATRVSLSIESKLSLRSRLRRN
jgi:hypothetical protein